MDVTTKSTTAVQIAQGILARAINRGEEAPDVLLNHLRQAIFPYKAVSAEVFGGADPTEVAKALVASPQALGFLRQIPGQVQELIEHLGQGIANLALVYQNTRTSLDTSAFRQTAMLYGNLITALQAAITNSGRDRQINPSLTPAS